MSNHDRLQESIDRALESEMRSLIATTRSPAHPNNQKETRRHIFEQVERFGKERFPDHPGMVEASLDGLSSMYTGFPNVYSNLLNERIRTRRGGSRHRRSRHRRSRHSRKLRKSHKHCRKTR